MLILSNLLSAWVYHLSFAGVNRTAMSNGKLIMENGERTRIPQRGLLFFGIGPD